MTLQVWLPTIRTHSGTDIYARRLADGLNRSGVTATISWFASWHEFAPALLSARTPPGTTLIHANSWNAYAFAKARQPLVVTSHLCVLDPLWLEQASLAQRLYYQTCVHRWESRSFAAATAITAVSRHAANSLSRVYGVRSCQVIHNWVDTDVFSPETRRVRSRGPFRLLFVGNFTRRKGADLLPRIAKRLGPDFELRCIGLRSKRPRAKWPDNMLYLNPVSDECSMAEIYRDCDALLFPSRWEGFGYAPLEALACGRPVIATSVSALPEVVQHGETGMLCPLDDVDAFVAACQRLAGDDGLWRRMSEAAREDAVQRFSEERAIAAYLEVYRNSLSRNPIEIVESAPRAIQ